jgi:Ca-activated chloride channel family protein
LTVGLCIVALAGPRFANDETETKASGVDIMLVLDLSWSMMALDMSGPNERVSRFDIASQVLEDFVRRRPSDRLGLLVFSAVPYLASPLTLDHDFLLQNLERLEIATQDKDGTAIGSALAAALNRLREVKSKSKIVILMTDGQNNAGKVPPLTAAEAAETLKVKVYTIGVGTRGMAPMPYIDPFGRKGTIPQPVDIDEDTLKEIAKRTGGRYYRADNTEALRSIYDEIDGLEKTEVQVKKYQRYREVFPLAALPGLVLLLLEIILNHTVWRKLP